jgi:TM2 domain-containing membrane protein YozV
VVFDLRVKPIPKRARFSHGETRNPRHDPDMEQQAIRQPTHSTFIGYLLWIFGFTGAHRFYYGRQITGVIWFCTLGLLGIGWRVDLFLIPGMNRSASHRYRSGPFDYTVAWILQPFLGLIGIHRFYLGKIWTGILWLLTGGLFGIGYLYDFFTLNGQVDECNAAAQ